VPLAPLDDPVGAEDLLDGLPEPFSAVNNAEQAVIVPESPFYQTVQEIFGDPGVFRSALNEPQGHLLATDGNAKGHDELIIPENLPIHDQGNEIVTSQRPLLELLKLLKRCAEMNFRDTVEELKENAWGISSAHSR
jgi:hypothetical protein